MAYAPRTSGDRSPSQPLPPSHDSQNVAEKRVLVHSSEKEAKESCAMLGRGGIACMVLLGMDELCAELAQGAGAVLVAEEELAKPASLEALAACIARQPDWSDLPVIILADCDEARSHVIERAMEALQAPLLVERPLRAGLLTSAIRAALRGRERQYQIRDYLAERERDTAASSRQADLLEQRTSLLRALNTATTDLIFVKDLDGRIVMGNAAFFKARGPESKVVGKTDLAIHADPEQAQHIADNDRQVVSTGQTQTFEERVGPHGAVATMLSTKSPYRDENGTITGLIGISRDISERKRMEEALRASEHLYRGIGESIDYGVWVCDPHGHIIYTSESFLSMVGMSQQEYADSGWPLVLHPDDIEGANAAWEECAAEGAPLDIELRFRGGNGEYHPVLARGVPVRNDEGGIICWAGINLDISRQKAAEDSLREADRRKDEFLASLAHELRNPLAPISNALQLLHLRTPTKAESDWARNIIERQVKQLTRLIDDLLDLSRITRGKVTLRKQRIYLATVIHDAVETSRPVMETASHRFSLVLPDKAITIEADPLRLAQVLANLLNNAAKYTYPGGRITLSAAEVDSQVVIRIKDTGIGIAPEMLPRIFEMFIQADKTLERVQGGLGIGLTLVRLFVQMHGGTVEAHSEGLNKGSEFVVRLPIGNIKRPPAELPSTRPTTVSAHAARKLRIVVADDNRDSVESMLLLLDMWGHEVRAAYDGAQGLEAVAEFKPDVVLLDIGMPELNGYDAARKIRELTGERKIMLIAVTGWGQEDDRRKSQDAGFDHHLVKPIDWDVLQELLAAAGGED